MNIVIAGYGPVGQACYKALTTGVYENSNNVSVFIDDPYQDHDLEIPDYIGIDAVVVCVSTPQADDGTCFVDNVKDVFEKYKGAKFLVKSTVDSEWLILESDIQKSSNGSTVTMSPEFLRGTVGADPIQEFMDQTFAIYGGDDPRFWHELFKPNLTKLKEVRFLSLEQALFAKYLENCFLATKVTFFNEMHRVYKHLRYEGFDTMVEAITLDERIGFSHTQVPGPDGKFGFGGHCLPKDTSAFVKIAGGKAELMGKVRELNDKLRNHRKSL